MTRTPRSYGQEINPTTFAIARMNAVIHNNGAGSLFELRAHGQPRSVRIGSLIELADMVNVRGAKGRGSDQGRNL
jgi:hypothetical protein